MWKWIAEYSELLFGGGGILGVISGLIIWLTKRSRKKERPTQAQPQDQVSPNVRNYASLKATTTILFIDDEKFENVSVLKRAGWINTKTISDINNIDDPNILWANIIFVDINGVGCKLFPTEQGLGVAHKIKERYPDKYVVIYSARPQELHRTFSNVDATLSKNADPYEYISILEDYINHRGT